MAGKVYDYVEERVVAALEEAIKSSGVAPWQRPWRDGGMMTYISRQQYSGVNRILLPDCGEYLTHNQIRELSRRTPILAYRKMRRGTWLFFGRCKEFRPKTRTKKV